ncbi:hypothetical protein C1O63_0031 [Dehalococcoides mccartyi]|jgi:hypothetical protein|nr:hypothetical protein C1O63_0031 [Dehalococcoides mccartyi]
MGKNNKKYAKFFEKYPPPKLKRDLLSPKPYDILSHVEIDCRIKTATLKDRLHGKQLHKSLQQAGVFP